MKSGALFWGSFFISLGACFLLSNFDMINFSGLSLGYMWPILLIVFGISLLKLSEFLKRTLSALSGLLLALLIVGTVSSVFSYTKEHNVFDDEFWTENFQETKYYVHHDEPVERAILNFHGGAGVFKFDDYSGTDNILKAKTHALKSTCKDYFDNDSIFSIDFYFNHNINSLKNLANENNAKIDLNRNVLWDVNLNTGACEMDLDFRKVQLKNLIVKTGASSLNLDLGDKTDTCFVSIKNGVSEVNIDVPEDAVCRIYTKSALSSESFIGFVNKGNYFEALPEKETKKYIEISIEGGVSDYYIKRSHR